MYFAFRPLLSVLVALNTITSRTSRPAPKSALLATPRPLGYQLVPMSSLFSFPLTMVRMGGIWRLVARVSSASTSPPAVLSRSQRPN